MIDQTPREAGDDTGHSRNRKGELVGGRAAMLGTEPEALHFIDKLPTTVPNPQSSPCGF